MNNWGGKRQNCGRKKQEKPIKKDYRSEELKAVMRKNTEINDKYLMNQSGGNIVRPRFRLGNTDTYYMGGW